MSPSPEVALRHVLITGGAGFIGSRLALALAARGHDVRVLDNLSPQIHGDDPEASPLLRSIVDNVEFQRGSVCDDDDLRRALREVDTVVHLAAETGTGQSMDAIRRYAEINVGGTAALLDVIANDALPVRRLVVASSRAVYGEGRYNCAAHGAVWPSPRLPEAMQRGDFELHCPTCGAQVRMVATNEDTPVAPQSVYGVTKVAQEQLVLAVGQALGISAIAFRFQNVYGPGQSLTNPYTGILSIFSTRIRNGSGLNIFEDGLESRDFVFIDDAVDATVRGLEYERPIVDVFNVGSGVATDVLTIASNLQQLLGVQVPVVVSGQFRVGDIRHNVADLAKVRAVLGYEPSVALGEGLRRFVAWVKAEEIPADGYEASLAELRARGLFK